MPVNLGMPAAPAPVLAPRRKTRQIKVGKVVVGGDAPISVQSMTTTKTTDINATLQQIAELTATGCDIVRVAVPSQDDAEALPIIAMKSQIPVIADIHFQPRYVFAAIDAGCAAVRVNPGNIKQFDDKVARDRQGGRRRRGVTAHRRQRRLARQAPARQVRRAHRRRRSSSRRCGRPRCSRSVGFHDFKISVKHNDPVVMVRAYELLSEKCDYPLHLGVTEAGPGVPGHHQVVRRVRGPAQPRASATPSASRCRPRRRKRSRWASRSSSRSTCEPRKLEIVSCPSCGRAQVDVYTLAEQVTKGLEGMQAPLRVAVMGCVVNGPGEAREADLGVASGNGKGQIFVKGEVIKTVPEDEIVETLIIEAQRLAAEMGEVGAPSVSVS